MRSFWLLWLVSLIADRRSQANEATTVGASFYHDNKQNTVHTSTSGHTTNNQQLPSPPRRGLQSSSDPCTAAEFDAKIFDYNLAPPFVFFKPSYFVACLESFVFDDNGTHMMDHITSLYGLFDQYHFFFDIAKDPKASEPLMYQQELGYKVYGEHTGKVNLLDGLQRIIDDIQATGVASQATFWNISAVFNKLRDRTVRLQLSSFFPEVEMTLIPERIVQSNSTGATDMEPIFTFDNDEQIQLTLRYSYGTNQQDESLVVSTIDGRSVHDFVLFLANEPAMSLGYQSVGARINALIASNKLFDFPNGHFTVSGRPTDVLPDVVQVVYENGSTEVFRGAVAIDLSTEYSSMFYVDPTSGYYSVNRAVYESRASQPGKIRSAFDTALFQITSSPYFTPVEADAQSSVSVEEADKNSFQTRKRRLERNFEFQDVNEWRGKAQYAYSIKGDHAILKVGELSRSPEEMYLAVAKAAKEAGVKKLMIDLSDSDGLTGWDGLVMAHLLYPSIDVLTWFESRFQIKYNAQMDSFARYTLPLLDDMLSLLLDDQATSALLASLVNTTDEAIELAAVAVARWKSLCPSIGFACMLWFEGLRRDIKRFAKSQSLENFRVVLQIVLRILQSINPWTVGLPQTWNYNSEGMMAFINDMPTIDINFGGTVSSYTDRFDFALDSVFLNATNRETLEAAADIVAKTTSELGGFAFDEFVIVSNGVSNAGVFATAAEQIWKNRDRSGVTQPLVTVAYGGSGASDDTAMASFYYTSDRVDILDVSTDYPLVAFITLYAWEILVSENTEYSSAIKQARKAYDDVLVKPPYFSTGVPVLPVMGYFDTFMGPDALPMQYISMPPDVCLLKFYTRVSIDYSSDLAALYSAAAAYFPSARAENATTDKLDSKGAGPSSGASSRQRLLALSMALSGLTAIL